MKKSISFVAALVVAASAYGQGTISFNNLDSTFNVKAAVYGPETSDPTAALFGNTSNPTYSAPLGSTVYSGARLDGAGYSLQLFGGPSSVTDSTLLQSCTVGGNPYIASFRTGSAAGIISPSGGTVVTVPGAAYGATASLQMRAWDNNGGAYATYAAAEAAPGGYVGASQMFTSVALAEPPATTTPLTGVTSFNIHQVPEPSTIALGVIGIGAFLARRRKQQ